MTRIDCGIDIGSTNLKVILVAGGKVLWTRAVPSPRVSDGIGPVTDPMAMVAQLEDMILEGWRAVGAGVPLGVLAAAGVGEDGVGVGPDLSPTGPAIPWFDGRARAEAETLAARFAAKAEVTGIGIDADRTIAKWLWLRHNRPAELDRATSWVALTDFPAAFWAARPFMSASLAARTAAFNVFERAWIGEMLEAVGAPSMPEILGAGAGIGPVTRGRLLVEGAADANTLVAAGGHDHPMAAMVIRRHDPAALVDSLGTANLLYGETRAARPGPRAPGLALSLAPDGSDALACLGVLEMDRMLAASGASPRDVRAFLDADPLAGAPPRDATELARTSGDGALRRALERECLAARRILDRMEALGVPAGPLYCTGGRSRSSGLMGLRASVLGRPLHVLDDLELSALGAAQAAADASGAGTVCTFEKKDIKTVEPCVEWAKTYKMLAMQGQAVEDGLTSA